MTTWFDTTTNEWKVWDGEKWIKQPALLPRDWKNAYYICVTWQDGRITQEGGSSSPSITRAHGKYRISRNPQVIKRIEMHDLTGSLEAIWDASWETSP